MENGYSICLNEWALDKEIKNELGLLLIISSLTAEKGYCYASNEYLADLFETTETTISKKIKSLETKQYIKITYKKRGCEIISRQIRLSKKKIDDCQKRKPTIVENNKDNNISINNTKEINNNKLLFPKKKFKKPTLDEVQQYCLERNNNISAEKFIDYYESNGWKVGRNSMKDWKAAIRNWEKNQQEKQKNIKIYKSNYEISQEALRKAREEYENE